jgi:hypothetical protein
MFQTGAKSLQRYAYVPKALNGLFICIALADDFALFVESGCARYIDPVSNKHRP